MRTLNISTNHLATLIKVILIILLLASIVMAVRLFQNVMQEHHANKVLIETIRSPDPDYQELLKLSEDLVNHSILEGGHTDFKARVESIAFSRGQSPALVSEQAVLESFKTALRYKPYSANLWSNFALHAASIDGISQEVLSAVDSAIEFGKNDYQTIQFLALIAIKEWSNFNCEYKKTMLGMIDAALTKNDHILSQWAYQNRHMPIGKYVTLLMESYGFKEDLAREQVAECARN